MKKLPTIFLSYNPNSEFEETLAIRMQTLGAVHGFNMLLPDRYDNREAVSTETRNRIMVSDYFILFSTSVLHKKVREEILLAFNHLNDKSKIIVIYDKQKGKNITGADNCTEIYVDSRSEGILQRIIAELQNQESKQKLAKQKNTPDVLGGLLLSGLGLLLLGSLADAGKGGK
jgi:hypothetical protein